LNPRILEPSNPLFTLSPAERYGLMAISAAILLAFWQVRLAILPLALFVLACWAAPFCPRFGFFLPIVSRGDTGKRAVALTFDDGPDPRSTPHLLKLLRHSGVQAAFFVTGKKAARHPELIRAILRDGHAVGNHTYSHDNLVMFRTVGTIVREIESTQDVLGGFGITALAFRPPVGITGPRLRPALIKTGRYLVNFSCRAFDCGNRRIKGLSGKILKCAVPGSIILLHDTPPSPLTLLNNWVNEIEMILSGLKDRGLAVLPLAEIIGRPVMEVEQGARAQGVQGSSELKRGQGDDKPA